MTEDEDFVIIIFFLFEDFIELSKFGRVSNEATKVYHLDIGKGGCLIEHSFPILEFFELPGIVLFVASFHDEFVEVVIVDVTLFFVE